MPEKAKVYSGKIGKGNSTFKMPTLYQSKDWVEYSKKFLIANKKCYSCGEKSQVTDHWTAHKNDVNLFWNPHNVLPLCAKCHNTVTSNFDKFTPPKTKEKLEWINEKRVQAGITFAVKFVPLKEELKRKREFKEEN